MGANVKIVIRMLIRGFHALLFVRVIQIIILSLVRLDLLVWIEGTWNILSSTVKPSSHVG